MKRQPTVVIAGMLTVLLIGGVVFLTTQHSSLITHRSSVKATYY